MHSFHSDRNITPNLTFFYMSLAIICIQYMKIANRYKLIITYDMETLSVLLALCEGNPSVTDRFPSHRSSNAGLNLNHSLSLQCHEKKQLLDDVMKWKHFPRYWPFVRGIHRSAVNSPHKGQWRGALVFSLICVWVNNREAGDLRRYRAHHDVIVLIQHTRRIVDL